MCGAQAQSPVCRLRNKQRIPPALFEQSTESGYLKGDIKMFKLNKNKFLTSNDNYYYKNYFTVFKKYLLVKKEKLVHPYWNLQNRTEPIRKEAGN